MEFLFWSNSNEGGEWVIDWSTWQWHYVTSRPENPFRIRFDSSIDDTFSSLLSTENEDKFRPNAKTKIIIHGYTENGQKDWVRDMAHAYFDSGIDYYFSTLVSVLARKYVKELLR